LEIYLTEEIFSRLLASLSSQLAKDYAKKYPVLIGVGISGIEMVGRMPSILGRSEIETRVCDVERVRNEIKKITNFPDVAGKRVLLCYVRVDTGRTLIRLTEHALKNGATDVKTMSIAARAAAECFPNYYCFMLKSEDNLFLLLDGYPPDLLRPYPPVRSTPLLLRRLRESDAKVGWLKCGTPELDMLSVEDFLRDARDDKVKCNVFVLEERDKVVGLAQAFQIKEVIYLACVMIDKEFQGKKLGSKLISFLIDWGRFNGFSHIELCSLVERIRFYEGLGFEKFGPQETGESCVMMRRELY
jgi:GNAT superfamily N-acetyltransferase/hypoxanthine-guanine phosphoribosyltransferase